MAEITNFSNLQQEVIRSVIKNDNGFHTGFYIAEQPLYDMLSENDDGTLITKQNVDAPLGIGSETYDLNVRYSQEQKCWFFTFTYGTETFAGIVHFNTVYNARGEVAIVILNDNETDAVEDISISLPYSNVLVLRK